MMQSIVHKKKTSPIYNFFEARVQCKSEKFMNNNEQLASQKMQVKIHMHTHLRLVSVL